MYIALSLHLMLGLEMEELQTFCFDQHGHVFCTYVPVVYL